MTTNNKPVITAIGTANPEHRIPQMETATFMGAALQSDDKEKRKIKALYRMTGINYRHSVVEDYGRSENFHFYPNSKDMEPFPTVSKRMKLYHTHAPDLAVAAILDCVKNVDLLKEVTHLITVSCTGMYAPGLDIEIVEKLQMNTSVKRTCINFMGCYAAFNALKMADVICRAEENAKVLIVSVELCTIHFQKQKTDDQLLSNAIFADGAAACLVANEDKGLVLEGFHCDLAFDGKHDMAWHIGDHGFEMVLSSYVARVLERCTKELIEKLLNQLGTKFSEIDVFATHPGGKKILHAIEKATGIGKDVHAYSYDVLQNYGNMSSATVLFVLKQVMESEKEGKILSMAFGPGLTVESALLTLKK